MARGAELAILTCRGHFTEQIFKGVAHYVLGSRAFAGASKELVDGVDGIRQHLALVRVKLKVGVGHAVIEAGQFCAISAGAAEMFVKLT